MNIVDLHWEQETFLSTMAWSHYPFVQLSPDKNEYLFVCLSLCLQCWTGAWWPAVRTPQAGCFPSWTPIATCTWTRQSWLPSIWTNTRSAFGPSSNPVTPSGTARFPQQSGASASGERVSIVEFLWSVSFIFSRACVLTYSPSYTNSNFKALSCPQDGQLCVVVLRRSLFVILLLLIFLFSYGAKWSPQATKNIPAAC